MNKSKSYLIIGGILLLSSIKSFAQEVGVNYFYGWGSLQNVYGEVYDESSLEDRYRFSNTQGVRIHYAQEMIEKFPLTYYVSYQRSTLNFQFHLMEDISSKKTIPFTTLILLFFLTKRVMIFLMKVFTA